MDRARIPLKDRNLPLFRSHKTVGALQIADVSGQTVSFEPIELPAGAPEQHPPETFPPDMFVRFTPSKGDWFVVYEDGYESFSPRKAFEEGYLPTSAGKQTPEQIVGATYAIPALELELASRPVAPRVTPDDIERNIVSCYFFTAAEGVQGACAQLADGVAPSWPTASRPPMHPSTHLLTFCVLVLENGFIVTGQSACASPDNFDASIGKRIAREDAVRQCWGFMGYELRSKLAARAQHGASEG